MHGNTTPDSKSLEDGEQPLQRQTIGHRPLNIAFIVGLFITAIVTIAFNSLAGSGAGVSK